MNVIELEEKAKKIIKFRTERKKIQAQINVLVAEIISYMDNISKKRFVAGSYSFEIATRIRRDFDFKALDELQAKGLIPEKTMKKSTYDRLLITSGKNLDLIDGKWVRT